MKKIIFITLIIAAAFGFLLIVKYFVFDQSTVTFSFAEQVKSINIYRKSDNKKVTSLSTAGNTRLVHDVYYAIAVGDIVSDDHTEFTLPSKSTVVIDPDYSEAHLANLAKDSTPLVNTLLNDTYPSLMSQYTVQNFTLYKKGTWGGGLLVHTQSTQNDTRDTYRFVVQYTDGAWALSDYPDIVLMKAAYPFIPSEVLVGINNLNYDLPN